MVLGSTSVVRRSQLVVVARLWGAGKMAGPWAPFCVALRLVLRKRGGIFVKSGWLRVYGRGKKVKLGALSGLS